jgi:RNA polymerase sigma-70 factor, ECF subfamily
MVRFVTRASKGANTRQRARSYSALFTAAARACRWATSGSASATRPFKPWLLTIVRNRLADRARRDIRRATHEVPAPDPDVTFLQEPANTPDEDYGDSAALRRAVSELPAGQRRAIELLKIQELSLKEAAEATGTSVGALKVATHRAMAALRKALSKS